MNPLAPAGAEPTAATQREGLRREVLSGLSASPRILPTRLLYDAEGSRLFERITRLPEYYLTRTEMAILRACLGEVAEIIGPAARIIEPGSGSGAKARLLLETLERPSAYIPVEIAPDPLDTLSLDLQSNFPQTEIIPVRADYTTGFDLPTPTIPFRKTLVFFPGSTIGNFGPEAARAFLARLRATAGATGALLLGADLRKPAALLEPAYNDAQGVTAAFNRNLLRHLNRLLNSDFDPDGFEHRAPWVAAESRIEMHLVARRDQVVRIPALGSVESAGSAGDHAFALRRGESIVTEHSYKYAPERLDALVAEAGWRLWREWRDPAGWYSVRLLLPRA